MTTIRFHYDWEFKENGQTIEPISLGMVADNGSTLYVINRAAVERFYDRKYFNQMDKTDEWLEENVFNHITSTDVDNYGNAYIPEIAKQVSQFILDNTDSFKKPNELWGYFAAYDHVCLAQLFGRMLDLPPHIPMYTNELMTIRNGRSKPGRPASLPEHHALNDAKYQKLIYERWSK